MSHHQPDKNKSVNLTIDGLPVTVPEGTRILEAAKKANVHIPTLCEHPDLCKRAVCRICVVEADGRSKLVAACANDVWEGVSIVTNNQRLQAIRKTIVELLLANHPQDCLACIRNKKCELQSLAEDLGIRATPFERDSAGSHLPIIENEILVRNMDKCVKCGRCVEMCQEVQTIRAINSAHRSAEYEINTPYKQALSEGPCVFCGKCATVCPVGAIYEHDQSAEVWSSLNDSGRQTIAQVPPSLAKTLNDEFGFAEGTVTTGKITAALKQLGFNRIFDAKVAAMICISKQSAEVQGRITNAESQGCLPMISGHSAGVANFVKYFYPDLAGNLSTGKSPLQIFAALIKADYAKDAGIEPSNITSVTFTPGIAQKYRAGAPDTTDFALSAAELRRMIKLAGINIETLPEAQFDSVTIDLPAQDSPVKKETVSGFANARKVMEAIRKGECEAQWVIIAD